MLKTSKQMDEKPQQNLHQQHIHNEFKSQQQEEINRVQEFQKHSSSLNLSQLSGIQNGNLTIIIYVL